MASLGVSPMGGLKPEQLAGFGAGPMHTAHVGSKLNGLGGGGGGSMSSSSNQSPSGGNGGAVGVVNGPSDTEPTSPGAVAGRPDLAMPMSLSQSMDSVNNIGVEEEVPFYLLIEGQVSLYFYALVAYL